MIADLSNHFVIGRDGSRDEVIAKHERWLADQHDLLRVLDELRGRDFFGVTDLWRDHAKA